jgi:hypothetical protein
VLALQGAYVLTGKFDPGSDTEDDEFDPGDQLLVLGLVKASKAGACLRIPPI